MPEMNANKTGAESNVGQERIKELGEKGKGSLGKSEEANIHCPVFWLDSDKMSLRGLSVFWRRNAFKKNGFIE